LGIFDPKSVSLTGPPRHIRVLATLPRTRFWMVYSSYVSVTETSENISLDVTTPTVPAPRELSSCPRLRVTAYRNAMYCAHLEPKIAIDRRNFYWTTGTTCLSFRSQRSRRALLTPRSLRPSWDREYIANVLRPSGCSI
jgi:hypothetical protein